MGVIRMEVAMIWQQSVLYYEASLFSGGAKKGYVIAQTEDVPKFRNLQKGEKLNQSLVNKHFF